jgi:hypothetical protein
LQQELEMTFRKIPLSFLVLILCTSAGFARKQPKYAQAHQLTADQAALVQRAIGREKVLIKSIQEHTPLVETYIQDTRPDQKLYEVPVNDTYMLSRVDFGKGFFDKAYEPRDAKKKGFFKNSIGSIMGLSKALGLDSKFTYNPLGFTEMMFLDPTGFDQQHYQFSYVRREFLGSVRTWVFDVHPKVSGQGRFFGRIWIEDQDGNIVRFNGTFTSPNNEDSSKYYFHFDSWRMNLQPGIWLPVGVYVEESQRGEGSKTVGLKAQTHFWGYSLKLPTRDSENVSVKVDDAEDKSDDSQDVSPLQAQREWVLQAENNVLDRLTEAGLLAPPTQGGYEQTVLEQIVTNLAVPNNLAFTTPVRCRVMLTDTVETTTVGNTIILSKGLIDAMPDEPTIASVIAMELAHIVMGHHIDTRYAFNDRLLFPDESTFQRIDMNHTIHDNEEAQKRALQYLQASMYKDRLPQAGLFWEQLADRGKVLHSLNTPKLGDSLLRADGTPWMSDLAHQAPKINWDDLAQTPALPLGSWLKTDPWDDHVHMLNAKHYAPMNPRDKMPLEVTPVYFKLQRYNAANEAPSTSANPGAQSTPPANDANQPPEQQNQPANPGQQPPPAAAAQPAGNGDTSAQQQQQPPPVTPQLR